MSVLLFFESALVKSDPALATLSIKNRFIEISKRWRETSEADKKEWARLSKSNWTINPFRLEESDDILTGFHTVLLNSPANASTPDCGEFAPTSLDTIAIGYDNEHTDLELSTSITRQFRMLPEDNSFLTSIVPHGAIAATNIISRQLQKRLSVTRLRRVQHVRGGGAKLKRSNPRKRRRIVPIY